MEETNTKAKKKRELKKDFVRTKFASRFGKNNIISKDDGTLSININELGFIDIPDDFIQKHFRNDYLILVADMANYYCDIICKNNPESVIDLLNKAYISKHIRFKLDGDNIKVIDINGIEWNFYSKYNLNMLLESHLNLGGVNGRKRHKPLDVKGMFNAIEEYTNQYFIKLPDINERLKDIFTYLTKSGTQQNYGVLRMLHQIVPTIDGLLEIYSRYADTNLVIEFKNNLTELLSGYIDVEQYGILKNRIVIFDGPGSCGGAELDEYEYTEAGMHLLVKILTEFMDALIKNQNGEIRFIQALTILSPNFIDKHLQENTIKLMPINTKDILKIADELKNIDSKNISIYETEVFDEIINYFEVPVALKHSLENLKANAKKKHKFIFDKMIAKCEQ